MRPCAHCSTAPALVRAPWMVGQQFKHEASIRCFQRRVVFVSPKELLTLCLEVSARLKRPPADVQKRPTFIFRATRQGFD
mmetsp:Transcript_19058/g.44820  ORF Transcript_19058/g.44820 Transcript_19058/m.44820 type:complete len:80 (+) Transcript_19058:1811-2050(+)